MKSLAFILLSLMALLLVAWLPTKGGPQGAGTRVPTPISVNPRPPAMMTPTNPFSQPIITPFPRPFIDTNTLATNNTVFPDDIRILALDLQLNIQRLAPLLAMVNAQNSVAGGNTGLNNPATSGANSPFILTLGATLEETQNDIQALLPLLATFSGQTNSTNPFVATPLGANNQVFASPLTNGFAQPLTNGFAQPLTNRFAQPLTNGFAQPLNGATGIQTSAPPPMAVPRQPF